MSDAIVASLNEQISRLQRENADLRAENSRRRKAQKTASEERDRFRTDLEAVTRERDQLKGNPDEQAATIADLRAQLAARDRRDEWRGAIDGKLADKVSVDEVMAKAGYKPDGKALTAEQITELVGKAREAAPYLFKAEGQEPSDAPNGATNAGRLSQGPGGSQGSPDKSSSRVTYTKDEVSRPGWQQARPELVEALQKGSATLVERK